MTYPVPEGTILGRLRLLEVYDVYDGPRLFSLASATGATFLAFWINEGVDADEWLYVGISPIRLDQVVEGVVSLREAFVGPEDGVLFRVLTKFEGASGTVTPITPSEIDERFLPLENDRLQGHRLRDFHEEANTQTIPQTLLLGRVQQKLKMERLRSEPIAFDAVTAVLSKWRILFETALEAVGGATGQLIPVLGTPGSFNLTLTLPKDNTSDQAFEVIRKFVVDIADGKTDFAYTDLRIDVRGFEALVTTLREHELMLTVEQEGASSAAVLDLRTDGPITKLAHDASLHMSLASAEVPQADDLDRVLRLLELMRMKSTVTADRMEVVDRQVNYYKQACRILRLLDEDNQLTSVGERIIALPHRRAKYEALAIQFETSTCGWRWIQWSNARRLLDIDPTDAEAFLLGSAPILSAATVKRRARTLETWCRALQQALLPSEPILLAEAEELANQGHLLAAAVIAGSALEEHLHKLATSHYIIPSTTSSRSLLPGVLNTELRNAKIYGPAEYELINKWQRVRNEAAHSLSHSGSFTTSSIKQMISELRRFIDKYPS